jgi:hypothetical protein
MLTNSDFPRNFSALAIKPLTILLSIGVHYVLASNLGIFSLPPLKPRPFGGTVKVVDLTPAERTRVPEVVRATPVQIVPSPSPSAVIRNFPDVSRLPAAPLTNPTPLPKKSSSAKPSPSENQPGSDKGSSNRPKKDIPKVKKPSDPTYSLSKKGPTLTSIKPDKPTSGTTSSKKPEEDEASGSENSAEIQPIKPPKPKPGNSSTPTPTPKNPPNGETRNPNKPFDSQISNASKSLKAQYGLPVVVSNISPIRGNKYATASQGNPGNIKYFEMAYSYKEQDVEPLGLISVDPAVSNLVDKEKRERLIDEGEKIAKTEHTKKVKNSPNEVKGKIFMYRVKFEIRF